MDRKPLKLKKNETYIPWWGKQTKCGSGSGQTYKREAEVYKVREIVREGHVDCDEDGGDWE